MDHPIVHFDIPAKSIKRAQKFYKGLFGWDFKRVMFGIDYWNITVLPEHKENDKKNTGISVQGGMTPRFEEGQRIAIYVQVASVDASSEKVMALGGKVLVPKTTVPKRGYFSYCEDTEGNVFALWEYFS